MKFHMDTSRLRIGAFKNDLHASRIVRALDVSADRVLVPAMKKSHKDNKSLTSGNLYRSIGSRIRTKGKLSASLDVGTLGVLYGLNVELGQAKGTRPNRMRLRRWVQKKLKPANLRAKTLQMERSIMKKGTKAKPFVRPVYNRKMRVAANVFMIAAKKQLGV